MPKAGAGGSPAAGTDQRAAVPPRSHPLKPPVGPLLRILALAIALLVPGMAAAIDVNVATAEQLQEVKGIGPKMAKLIIEERDRGGKFASIDDLSDRVRGIGPKKAAALQGSGLVAGGAAPEKTVAVGGAARGSTAKRNR